MYETIMVQGSGSHKFLSTPSLRLKMHLKSALTTQGYTLNQNETGTGRRSHFVLIVVASDVCHFQKIPDKSLKERNDSVFERTLHSALERDSFSFRSLRDSNSVLCSVLIQNCSKDRSTWRQCIVSQKGGFACRTSVLPVA